MNEKSQVSESSRLSQVLKAAGDELRLNILRALAKDSFGVLELSQIFQTKQSGMSHHLKVLATAQLVTTRKEGNSIFYRRIPITPEDCFADIKKAIFRNIDQQTLNDDAQQKLKEIYQQRAEASLHFFSENAKRFKQQQDLIAAFDVYGPHVQEALENADLSHREVALEVGPGAGEFLQVLCQQFTHVTALDNSAEMLKTAQKRCQEQGLNNIDFIQNDTSYCRDIPGTVDCAVINMVLHHTPSPQHIFEDVASALKPGACIIVCDLCEHNQDWTRDACGDLWLGFAPDDLTRWAKEHKLSEGKSSYFALRNGFQIQIREFLKT